MRKAHRARPGARLSLCAPPRLCRPVILNFPEPPKGATSVLGRGRCGTGGIHALRSGPGCIGMDDNLETASDVRISALGLDGKSIATFEQGTKAAGPQTWSWKPTNRSQSAVPPAPGSRRPLHDKTCRGSVGPDTEGASGRHPTLYTRS